MKIQHATPARNLKSIQKQGLLASKSKGLLKAVWLHKPARTYWAILHCIKRHKCNDMIVIECNVPRSWLTRSQRGLWYCKKDIPPSRIVKLVTIE